MVRHHKFPRQDKVIERLENQTQRELKRLREAGRRQIQQSWDSTKGLLRVSIREFYRRDFGGQSGSTWSLPLATKKGTLAKMGHVINRILADFHHESVGHASRYFKEIYRTAVLRNAYALDMLTPDLYSVKLPRNRMFTEAAQAIKTYQGPDADTAWKVRWSAWMDAYESALNNNLKMGALNDSTKDDAENEVDATRAGTPAYDMSDAFDRIFITQAIALQSQAEMDLAAQNEEMGIEEIWQTSFSARVCDICDSQKGLTMDQAEFEIPAHPNCECYWRLVPADWAELLRSGKSDDVDLARWMDANGIVPSSMVVRNDDGDIMAKAIVTFNDWLKGQAKVVSTAR